MSFKDLVTAKYMYANSTPVSAKVEKGDEGYLTNLIDMQRELEHKLTETIQMLNMAQMDLAYTNSKRFRYYE